MRAASASRGVPAVERIGERGPPRGRARARPTMPRCRRRCTRRPRRRGSAPTPAGAASAHVRRRSRDTGAIHKLVESWVLPKVWREGPCSAPTRETNRRYHWLGLYAGPSACRQGRQGRWPAPGRPLSGDAVVQRLVIALLYSTAPTRKQPARKTDHGPRGARGAPLPQRSRFRAVQDLCQVNAGQRPS